jgi:hypothetical protein
VSARDAQPGPIQKHLQHLSEVVRLDQDVSVEVADEVVVEPVEVTQTRLEGVHLGGEVGRGAVGAAPDELDPVGAGRMLAHDVRRRVGGGVVHDDPAHRRDHLCPNRGDDLSDGGRLVAGRRD